MVLVDVQLPGSSPGTAAARQYPEAAEMLCVCRTSIYELIWKEELIAVRIGRSVRLAVEQLEQFVSDSVAQSLRI